MLGKRVIRSQDRAGFIVNALLIPYLLSAIRMLESGFATAEDIDAGMVEGCAHPMGPLALADLIGLDTTLAVAESLYEEFKEPLYAPPPLLARMVDAGLLGRKAGRGFYDYSLPQLRGRELQHDQAGQGPPGSLLPPRPMVPGVPPRPPKARLRGTTQPAFVYWDTGKIERRNGFTWLCRALPGSR